MAKRIHFPKSNNGNLVLCNAQLPGAYHKTTNADHSKLRKHKTSTDPTEVTCERCLEQLSMQSNLFACPMCNQTTETFYITETLTLSSVVTALGKGRKLRKRIKERALVSITCPLCGATVEMTDRWQEVSAKMKINGYFSELNKFTNTSTVSEMNKV